MTEERALAIRQEMTLADTLTLGKVLAESGFFPEAKSAAQAVAKILTGRELGLGPMASLMGVVIVKGKPELAANLQAGLVKASGRYDYRVIALTDQRCELAFYQDGKELGRSTFTIEDAKRANLAGKDTYQQTPRNMFFARAMSNGVKWFCPDVTKGMTLYAPFEIPRGDGDGDIVEGTATIVQPEPDKHPLETVTVGPSGERLVVTQTAQAARPLAPEAIRDAVRRKARWHDGQRVQSEPITEKQTGAVVGLMADAVQQGGMTQVELDNHRHDVLRYLVGVTSTKALTKAEASAIIDWLKNGSAGEINQWARAECAGILKAVLIEAGQQELEL